jgi:hypothetical protein
MTNAKATETVTVEQIEALRDEAGAAGDTEMVAICERAIDGDESAADECAKAIRAAAANED